MLHAVIMAGGSGTRFWPQSRQQQPKQLLRLTGEQTMIQETVARIAPSVPVEQIWIVTNQSQAEQTAEQLPQLPTGQLIVEPCGRNTAPCIGLAAIQLLHHDRDATMLVMPADHVIQQSERFRQSVQQAADYLTESPESFVLFGVPPTSPATGFGYIECGETVECQANAAKISGLSSVVSFREKPNRSTAEEYLATGNFLWNCGIFVWRADTILAALQKHEPEIGESLHRLQAAIGGSQWNATLETEFPAMKKTSIDYAVLERSDNVMVMEAPFDWDDVGSWQSLPRLLSQDAQNNTIDAKHCGLDTTNCIIRSTDENHLIATFGIDDLLVVHTPDATLVAKKDDEEAIRKIVSLIEKQNDTKYL